MTTRILSRAAFPGSGPTLRTLIALGLIVGMAACGGGGGGSSPSGPMSFADSAPVLDPAPAQLPRPGAMNICQNYRLGARRIENLEVPDGARCVLEAGVTIDGNVELGNRSELYATGVTIGGNLQGQRAAVTLLEASSVGGNVQLDVGRDITVRDNKVDGSIQLVANGGVLDVLSNIVGGDIQLFTNLGSVDVSGNSVAGNLQCKENVPAPRGGNNVVQGNKEDQCAAL